MTAKEYLGQYRSLKTDIDSKIEQLEELRELAKSVSHSSGSSGSGGISDKVGKTVAKIVDMENEISCQIHELLKLKKEIESTIAKVQDPILRQLLTLVYINGNDLGQVAVKTNYSYRQIKRKHKVALNNVKDVLECPLALML